MIVCSCRNIRESDFDSLEDLTKRLLKDDIRCGSCLDDLSSDKYNALKSEHTQHKGNNYVQDTL